MSRLLLCALACSIAVLAKAVPLPLTTKDISLMLRSGYSSKTVMEELSTRRFADTLDTFKENKLIYAGASPELLMALKAGNFTVSAADAAKIQQQLQQQKELEKQQRAVKAQE